MNSLDFKHFMNSLLNLLHNDAEFTMLFPDTFLNDIVPLNSFEYPCKILAKGI